MEIEKKTKDPAAQTMLKIAAERGLSTAFQRAEEIKPCPIGSEGLCCKLCAMGPCRLVGKTEVGVCGATRATVAARNFGRMVAAGAAAHSDHGRDLAFSLVAVAKGEAQGYRIRDVRKLYEVAKLMGIPTQGREVNDIALEVGEKALAEFGRQEGELLYVMRAPRKRQQIWQDLKIYPRGVDREIVEIMHRTHTGVDMDAENILDHAMRCALADGWGGSMLATDLSDILFGTPSPLMADINLSVLKDDEVNVVIHGHEPTLSEMIVAAAGDPELIQYAKSKGAKGINLAGICCTANEVLMRHGIPPAGNFLHQELAIITGAVDAMVVDVQCIMQGLAALAEEFHTLLITTSPKAKIPGATHIEFDEHHAYDTAKEIIRVATDNFPNRGSTIIPNPAMGNRLVAGFSHEYIGYMQGGLYRGSFRPLNDAIAQGRIRGVAAVVGCNNARVCQDEGITSIIDRFIAQDVLVVVTGCAGHGAGKYGYLTPEMMAKAGKGLREVCEAIGVPPVLHMGSCVDNSRILTVLSQMATEGGLGEDIADIPAVGICPEWMSEKAIAIGVYCVASGAYVLFGVHSPVAGCEEVTRLISEGWEAKTGGKLEFEPDIEKIMETALAHIDKKREALGLEKYNAERYGQSGDWRMEMVEAAIARGEEVNLRSYKELVKA